VRVSQLDTKFPHGLIWRSFKEDPREMKPGDSLMNRIGRKGWMKCFIVAAIIFGGCGPPITTRMVTIDLEKPPEAEMQGIKTIGVLPFSSPVSYIGRKMAADLAKALDSGPLGLGPFAARMIRTPEDFEPTASSIRKLEQTVEVDALVLGEIKQFSAQTSRVTRPMLSRPEFGPGDPGQYEWQGISEDASIKDKYYYRIISRQDPETVEVSITKLVSSLDVRIKLVDTQNGSILWEQEIARKSERIKFAGSQAETEAEVDRLVLSMVNEVVARLKPEEHRVQRLIKVPHFNMTPVAAKWVHRGIQAAAEDDWPQAEKLFLQALKEAPDECTVNGNLGVAYEKNGRLLEAVAAYERAYRCRPRDPTYRYYSDDLQSGFAPNLKREDLPTIVLGVGGDGTIYMSGGARDGHPAGKRFTVYRTEIGRSQNGAGVEWFKETDLARGRIVEVKEQLSLGQLLLYSSELAVQRGDLVRFETE
jgi:tetratricopeptide (TPR) repeat protein